MREVIRVERNPNSCNMTWQEAQARLQNGWMVYPGVVMRQSVGAQIATLQHKAQKPAIQAFDLWVSPPVPTIPQISIARALRHGFENGMDVVALDHISNLLFNEPLDSLMGRLEAAEKEGPDGNGNTEVDRGAGEVGAGDVEPGDPAGEDPSKD